MKNVDTNGLYANLENMGEDQVRDNLASGRVWGEDKIDLVYEWLARRERARADAFNLEQAEIARDAADAARDAADAAKSANTRAMIALVIATISAIATIISLYFQWPGAAGG